MCKELLKKILTCQTERIHDCRFDILQYTLYFTYKGGKA